MYQLRHVVLWCDVPTAPPEYITGAKIFAVNAQLHCSNYNGSYIHQLQSSHNQTVNVNSIKGNHISVTYIRLKLISGRYFGLTYKDT
jgi:hypothetical protein